MPSNLPPLVYGVAVLFLIAAFCVAGFAASRVLRKQYEAKARRELDAISGSLAGSSSAADRGAASEKFAEAIRSQKDAWEGAEHVSSRDAFLLALEEGEVSEEEYQARPDERTQY